MKKSMWIVVLAASLCLTGCGAGTDKFSSAADSVTNNMATDSWDEGFLEYEVADDAVEEETASTTQESSQEYSQKLIRTYRYSFETLDFDKSISFIEKKVSEYDGYIENSETSGSSHRYASLMLRIPQERADAFLSEVGSIGEIIYKSSSSEDITLNYYDTAAKLESLHTQHDRLLELLEQAASLEDIVVLETKLTDVEYEIDRYATMLRVYDNKVDYVTIHMDINEVTQIQVVEDDSVWTQIKKGLAQNTMDVIDGFVGFFILIVTGIPYFIVLGVFVLAVVLVIKKVRKARKNKEEQEVKEILQKKE